MRYKITMPVPFCGGMLILCFLSGCFTLSGRLCRLCRAGFAALGLQGLLRAPLVWGGLADGLCGFCRAGLAARGLCGLLRTPLGWGGLNWPGLDFSRRRPPAAG